jgi:dihydrofolate reductase
MRKVIFGGANSLDNYIARADGSFDWIRWSDEAAGQMAAFWKNIDTVLMGRKTFEMALRSGHGGGSPGVATYVFSSTLPERAEGGVTITARDVVEFVRELKPQDGKDIFLMGGGALARPLFEAELIDEIGFSIHPVLLGSGVSLFHPMSRQIDLELLECKPYRNGCVAMSYRVKRGEETP